MHKSIIKDASDEILREFTIDALSMLKETNPKVYEDLELNLYKMVYGCHFNKWLLDKALSGMENEDSTKGAHWTLDETTNVANKYSIPFDKFNEYDFSYVMNMIYSDYYGSVPDEIRTYAEMSRKFLCDKDAVDGKALKYYLSMKK